MQRTAQRVQRQLRRFADDPYRESEALGRRAFWTLARRFTPYLSVDRDGLRLLVSTGDQVLSRRLFVYHRRPEQDIIDAFAALRSVPAIADRVDGRQIVEIGANLGTSTVEMLLRYGVPEVIAIEPSPDNCRVLRHNLLANNLEARVSVLAVALSDRDGEVAFELSPVNAGDHRVRMGASQTKSHEDERPTIAVPARRFDSLVGEGKIDLESTGAVWMDAQGHEGHILSGAQQLLASDIPIITEYWPYGLRRADGLELFHRLVAEHFSHVQIISGADSGQPGMIVPAADLPHLSEQAAWSDEEGGADLLLSRHLGPD